MVDKDQFLMEVDHVIIAMVVDIAMEEIKREIEKEIEMEKVIEIDEVIIFMVVDMDQIVTAAVHKKDQMDADHKDHHEKISILINISTNIKETEMVHHLKDIHHHM